MTVRVARCGVMGAMLFGSQIALSSLPNFETVTPLLIVFALVYGKEAYWAAAVFNLCELVFWGPGTWWAAYLYIWNLLVLFTLLLRKHLGEDPLMWAAFAAVFGLSFGGLCALVYIPVSLSAVYAYWTAGLYWDIRHGICNFALTLALLKPLVRVLKSLSKNKNT